MKQRTISVPPRLTHRGEQQFQENLEKAACSKAERSLAEEKLNFGLEDVLPAAMQRFLANYREACRWDGLPHLRGCQALWWALRRFSKDEGCESTSALRAMLALHDSVRRQAVARRR